MTAPGNPELLLLGGDSAGGRPFLHLARARGARVVYTTVAPGDDPDALSGNASEEGIERAFAQAAERLLRLDAVVYAVSLPGERSRLGDLSLSAWDSGVVDGLRSAFVVARRTAEEFLAGGEGGRLVHIVDVPGAGSSEAGVGAEVTRAGLVALVRSVAKEYGPKNIACNAVFADLADASVADQAAELAFTLATPEGAYVTGEVMTLARSPGRR